MSLEYTIRQEDGIWSAFGEGPMRPITVEGDTPSIARQAYHDCYARQYEEEQRATHYSERLERYLEKNGDDLRGMVSDIRNYKGPAR